MPQNPSINAVCNLEETNVKVCYPTQASSGGIIQTIVGGTDISVDSTDPLNPIVNYTGASSTPDLQAVTNVGSTTTNSISVVNAGVTSSSVNQDYVISQDLVANKYAGLNYDGSLFLSNGITDSYLKSTNTVALSQVTLEFPNKATGSYTIATTADLGIIDLQTVTDNGNTTNNDIEFIPNAGILLGNGSRLREGTIDAGTGGSKGIAQICAVGYELKWEAGTLYVMDGNGLLIRESRYNFTNIPAVTNDNTEGFYVGSRWVLDNGDTYVCTDATTGAAVWNLQSAGGTVTSIATSGLISGGTITTSGTISTAMNTNRLVGRSTALVGEMEEITVGTGLTLSGGTLSATGGAGGIQHATATGTDTYAATITGVTSYADGDAYLIRFTNGNTTSATLNINSIGAVSLYRNNDGALIGGDIWAGGEMLCIYNSTTGGFQCIGTSPNSLFAYITNADSVTITKGQPVYAFGGTGDRMTVKLAYNTGDATSAKTLGFVLSTSIAANQKGIIILQGLLDGLSILPTSTWADGDTVYLGSTAGSITPTKQYAPNHLVYLGIVTTANNGSAGRLYVRVQNGFEMDELHNVQAQTPTLKDTLYYDNTVSPAQWKTASIGTILGFTPQAQLNGTGFVKASGTTISYDNSTYLTSAAIGVTIQGYNASTTTLGNTTTGSGTTLVLSTSPTFGTSIITPTVTGVTGALTFTNAAQSSGAVSDYTFTSAAHTNQTTTSEIIAVNFNLSATVQHATGTITTQRDFLIQARTHSFVGASTITSAGTLTVSAAPIAGTNATITNKYSIWSQSGNVYFQDSNATNFRFGDAGGGNAGISCVWLDQATSQTSSNFTIGQNGTNSYLNTGTGGTIYIGVGTAETVTVSSTTLSFIDGKNMAVGTSTGTKIGTTTSQKLAFWNKTPIVQPTTAITGATFVANSGTAVNDASTFGGYTLAKVVAALVNSGILA